MLLPHGWTDRRKAVASVAVFLVGAGLAFGVAAMWGVYLGIVPLFFGTSLATLMLVDDGDD